MRPIVTFYRVQSADGRGPFQPGITLQWSEDREDKKNLRTWLEEMPGALSKRTDGLNMCCGCLTLDQLRRWFTESEYRKLIALGFYAVKVTGCLVEKSETQALFETIGPASGEPFDLYSFAEDTH